MAKGVTNAPLHIHVADQWYSHTAVLALMRQGHEVIDMAQQPLLLAQPTPDLILHPAAGWDETLFMEETRENGTKYRPYVDAALMRARARRKKAK